VCVGCVCVCVCVCVRKPHVEVVGGELDVEVQLEGLVPDLRTRHTHEAWWVIEADDDDGRH
jgi:hypothetical protein